MANSNLTNAKRAKNDEFYTQYHDIEKEIGAYLEFNPDVFRGKAYDPKKVSVELKKLYADSYVKNRKGVFEYILGGFVDTKLLDVRVFDEATKKSVYTTQSAKAESKSESNCPLCALGHDASKTKLWKLSEMDADHVAAWSKGGVTEAKNCQMLCKTHNRAKGNR